MIDLQTLVDYLAYFGWIVVFAGIIGSAVLLTLGRTAEARKVIFGTAVGAFILAFGWAIINTAIPQQSYNLPGWSEISYVIYAAAAFSTIFAAIELVRGNGREGLGYFLTAIALIFILNYGPSIFGVNNVNLQPPQVNAVFGIGIPGTQWQLGVPVTWLIDMPNVNVTQIQVNGQPVYQLSESIAFSILGIAILGDIIWTLWHKEDVFDTLKDVSKDAAAAVLLIVAMPSIYQIFATVINYIANSLVQPVANTITTMGDTAAALIAAGFAGGYFVPALADIASDILFSLAIAAMLAAIRFFAIAAALILFPIFMALWVFPPLRGAVKFLIEFVLGMAFSGVIAAGLFLTLLSIGTSNAVYAAILYLASPVLYGFLPMMISFVGGSGLLSAGTNLIPFKRGRGGQGSKQTQQSGGGVVVAPVPAPAGGVNAQASTVGTTRLRTGRNLQGGGTATAPVQQQQQYTPLHQAIKNRDTMVVTAPVGTEVKKPWGYKIESVQQYQTPPANVLGQKSPLAVPRNPKNAQILPKDGIRMQMDKMQQVKMKETWWHATGKAMARNMTAGVRMTAEQFATKMDDWLNQRGVSIRPTTFLVEKGEQAAGAIVKGIKEIKLRKQKARKP